MDFKQATLESFVALGKLLFKTWYIILGHFKAESWFWLKVSFWPLPSVGQRMLWEGWFPSGQWMVYKETLLVIRPTYSIIVLHRCLFLFQTFFSRIKVQCCCLKSKPEVLSPAPVLSNHHRVYRNWAHKLKFYAMLIFPGKKKVYLNLHSLRKILFRFLVNCGFHDITAYALPGRDHRHTCRTWKYGMLSDLNDLVFRGRLPTFIDVFLFHRLVQARAGLVS